MHTLGANVLFLSDARVAGWMIIVANRKNTNFNFTVWETPHGPTGYLK